MSADALRRKLLNDEPKCANCDFWKPHGGNSVLGSCERVAVDVRDDKPIWAVTSDLSVCSGWEQK